MSTALQVALFIASVAFTVLMVCLIPIVFRIWRQVEKLVGTSDRLHEKLHVLVEDSRELVRHMTQFSKLANQQLDDMSQITHTVRQWSERADRLVDEVGSAIEPPVHSFVRNINLFRTGVTTFFEFLLHRNHHNHVTKEADHVGK